MGGTTSAGDQPFDWSGPHDGAVRRARFAFGIVVGLLAAYAAAVVVLIVACLNLGDVGPSHTLQRAIDALGPWGLAACAVALYGVVVVALAAAARGGFTPVVRSIARARPPRSDEAHAAIEIIDTFVPARGGSAPQLWLVDERAPNGFAVGTPRRGSVCLTSGALKLPRSELEALLTWHVTALTMPAWVYAMSAADLFVVCGVAVNVAWSMGVVVLLSAAIGVPGLAVAISVFGIAVLVAITHLILFITRRALPRLLDDVEELCDLETVRCTAQPRALGTLLVHLVEDDHRTSSSAAIAHRWFERDVIDIAPSRRSLMSRAAALLSLDLMPSADVAGNRSNRRTLAQRAEVAIELADGDATLIARLHRSKTQP